MEMRRPENMEVSEEGLPEFEMSAEDAKELGVDLESATASKEETPMDEHERAIRERVAAAAQKHQK